MHLFLSQGLQASSKYLLYYCVQVREGLVKGLEQAGDSRLPVVLLSRTLKGALCAVDAAQSILHDHRREQALQRKMGQSPAALQMLTACAIDDCAVQQRPPPFVQQLPWGVSYLIADSVGSSGGTSSFVGGNLSTDREEAGGYVAKALAHPDASSLSLLEYVMLCARAQREGIEHESVPAASKKNSPLTSCDRVLLGIGPEGGWREGELELLALKGFTHVNLGGRILTTTTAVISAVGQASCAVAVGQMSK
jgi:hypothetical protein